MFVDRIRPTDEDILIYTRAAVRHNAHTLAEMVCGDHIDAWIMRTRMDGLAPVHRERLANLNVRMHW